MTGLLLNLQLVIATIFAASCPCKDSSLCNNIKKNYSKELYGFIGGGKGEINDTSQYNWTYTTAFAVNEKYVNKPGMDNVMCEAHSNGVRMILWGVQKMPLTNNTNIQMEWIEKTFNQTISLHYDGITFDYEGSMLWTDDNSKYYTQLVNLTTQYFHKNLPGSTISVCVPFMAYLQWGRQYDYYNLAQSSDYLYIMGYDTNGQIWDGQCMARAVSPIMNIQRGVQSYINLQIPTNKLILGIPWYGKTNLCIYNKLDGGIQSKYCPIGATDSKGVNCSNGNNGKSTTSELAYAMIMNLVYDSNKNVTPIRWDNTQKTHYYNYKSDKNNMTQINQVWYDDVESLIYKYSYAKSMNLRGLGPFQFGDLIHDRNNSGEKQRQQAMWSAFDVFFT